MWDVLGRLSLLSQLSENLSLFFVSLSLSLSLSLSPSLPPSREREREGEEKS